MTPEVEWTEMTGSAWNDVPVWSSPLDGAVWVAVALMFGGNPDDLVDMRVLCLPQGMASEYIRGWLGRTDGRMRWWYAPGPAAPAAPVAAGSTFERAKQLAALRERS